MEMVKKMSPYLLVEILCPGGTLLAVLLYVFRHTKIFTPALSNRRPAVRPGM